MKTWKPNWHHWAPTSIELKTDKKMQNFPHNITILKNIPLAHYTSIKIGGPVDYLAFIYRSSQLITLDSFCRENGIQLLVLGHGTNVFFPEHGFRGIIAILMSNDIVMTDKKTLKVQAGTPLSVFTKFCLDNSLTGFEFTTGIPGTIGGAIYGNAGAYGKSIGECLQTATLLSQNGQILQVNADFFEFGYRYSKLKVEPAIILDATFHVNKHSYYKIKQEMDSILSKRLYKLPPPSCSTSGSWFKNIKHDPQKPIAAAKYLQAVGSKATRVGDAAVHPKHANIFYNRGRATASHMLKLENILKARVLQKFGIQLEREVMYINEV